MCMRAAPNHMGVFCIINGCPNIAIYVGILLIYFNTYVPQITVVNITIPVAMYLPS